MENKGDSDHFREILEYPYQTPKIVGKEGKNAQTKNKEILTGRKEQEIQAKKQGKEGQGL